MKYRIVKTEGCVAFGLKINDKDINDFTEKEKEEFIDYLLATVKEHIRNNHASIESLIGILQYDDFETDSHVCDQCGDSVSKTIWEI